MLEDNPVNYILAVMDHVEQMKDAATESIQTAKRQAYESRRTLTATTEAAQRVEAAASRLTKIHSAYVEEMNCRRLQRRHLWVLLPAAATLGFCAGMAAALV